MEFLRFLSFSRRVLNGIWPTGWKVGVIGVFWRGIKEILADFFFLGGRRVGWQIFLWRGVLELSLSHYPTLSFSPSLTLSHSYTLRLSYSLTITAPLSGEDSSTFSLSSSHALTFSFSHSQERKNTQRNATFMWRLVKPGIFLSRSNRDRPLPREEAFPVRHATVK